MNSEAKRFIQKAVSTGLVGFSLMGLSGCDNGKRSSEVHAQSNFTPLQKNVLVWSGDSVGSIAERCGVNFFDLKERIDNNNLNPGDIIQVPGEATCKTAEETLSELRACEARKEMIPVDNNSWEVTAYNEGVDVTMFVAANGESTNSSIHNTAEKQKGIIFPDRDCANKIQPDSVAK